MMMSSNMCIEDLIPLHEIRLIVNLPNDEQN